MAYKIKGDIDVGNRITGRELYVSANGSVIASIISGGSDISSSHTVITREKGDARYAQLSALNTFSEKITIKNVSPYIIFEETDQPADNKLFQLGMAGGLLRLFALNDNLSVRETVFTVDASGTAVTGPSSMITREKGDARYAQLNAVNNFVGRQRISSTVPTLDWYQTDAGTDLKTWRWISEGSYISLQTVNDAYTVARDAIVIERNGISISSQSFYINDVVAGIISPAGSTAPLTTTFMTREKGDARYLQLSANNTSTGQIVISNTSPTLSLLDTDAPVSSQRTFINRNGTTFSIQTGNATTPAQVNYEMVNIGNDGVGFHQFYVSAAVAGRIDPLGTNIPAATTIITREKGDARYAQLVNNTPEAGKILFNWMGNQYEPDYSVSIGKFVNSAAELSAAQIGTVDQSELFNRWYRFSHSSGAPVYPLTNDLNNLQGELSAWTYDTSAQLVRNTTNSNTVIGLVSLEKSDTYIIDAQIASTASDDDFIGLVISHVTEGVPNQPGYQEHTLSIIRNAGGGTPVSSAVPGTNLYTLQYNYLLTSAFSVDLTSLLPSKIHFKNGSATNNLGWVTAGVGCRLKVNRSGDNITVTTSELGTTVLNSATSYSFTLNDYPEFAKFKGNTRYGFMALSQGNSSWDADIITGSIYSLNENRTYNFTGSAWVATSATIDSTIGIGRILANPDTNKMYFVRGSNDYVTLTDSSNESVVRTFGDQSVDGIKTFTSETKSIKFQSTRNGVVSSPLFANVSGNSGIYFGSGGNLGIARDGVQTGLLEETGTAVSLPISLITREKGDARYAQLSAINTFTQPTTFAPNTLKVTAGGFSTSPNIRMGNSIIGMHTFTAEDSIIAVVSGVVVGSFDNNGTSAAQIYTVMTRQKGDARYPQLDSGNTYTGVQTIATTAPTLYFYENDQTGYGSVANFVLSEKSLLVQYRDNTFVSAQNVAVFNYAGTSLTQSYSVVTREKGDARYIQIGANVSGARSVMFNSDTAAAPGYTWSNNLSTGMYLPSSGIIGFSISGSEIVRMDSDIVYVGRTNTTLGNVGVLLYDTGNVRSEGTSIPSFDANRLGTDGDVIRIYAQSTLEGAISVAGTTVTYGAFSGSHWGQLLDNTNPAILRGTIIETIDQMCEWPGEDNDQLPKVKVSDTAGSNRVYGVFMTWDNDDNSTNDMYVTGLGAYVIRIQSGETIIGGELIESAGNGCGRVQSDDIIRSRTVAKVTSPTVIETYPDGSFLVPCVLYCG